MGRWSELAESRAHIHCKCTCNVYKCVDTTDMCICECVDMCAHVCTCESVCGHVCACACVDMCECLLFGLQIVTIVALQPAVTAPYLHSPTPTHPGKPPSGGQTHPGKPPSGGQTPITLHSPTPTLGNHPLGVRHPSPSQSTPPPPPPPWETTLWRSNTLGVKNPLLS